MENKLLTQILNLEDPKCSLPHPDLKQQELLERAGYPYTSYLDRQLREQQGSHIETIQVKKGSQQGFQERLHRNPRIGSLFQVSELPMAKSSSHESDHCIPIFVPAPSGYSYERFIKAARKVVIKGKYVEIEELIQKKLRERLLRLLYDSRFNQNLAISYLLENMRIFMDSVLADTLFYNRRTADTIITQFPK